MYRFRSTDRTPDWHISVAQTLLKRGKSLKLLAAMVGRRKLILTFLMQIRAALIWA
jgi:hypothetical protein